MLEQYLFRADLLGCIFADERRRGAPIRPLTSDERDAAEYLTGDRSEELRWMGPED